MMATTPQTIDATLFRHALGHYASGITVIASLLDGEPIGFTCQSFHSVSMQPPLVSFSVMAESNSYPKIRQAQRFSVNILAMDQTHISNQFAQRGVNKWQGIDWQPSARGNPFIEGCVYGLDCDIYAEHRAGDHIIVLGLVKQIHQFSPQSASPLIYYKGQYRGLSQQSMCTT